MKLSRPRHVYFMHMHVVVISLFAAGGGLDVVAL
jgi:hypothetical protein